MLPISFGPTSSAASVLSDNAFNGIPPTPTPSTGSTNSSASTNSTPTTAGGARRSHNRVLVGDESAQIAEAIAVHARSNSRWWKDFTAPRLATNPTHRQGVRLVNQDCTKCGWTLTRGINITTTNSAKAHLLNSCPFRERENGQTTLGQNGVVGTRELTREEVLQTVCLWVAESARPFTIIQDRRASLLSSPILLSLISAITSGHDVRSAGTARVAHRRLLDVYARADEEEGRRLRFLLHPRVLEFIHASYNKSVSDGIHLLFRFGRYLINATIKRWHGKLKISFDIWSAPNGISTAGFCIHGRDENDQLAEMALAFEVLYEAHTAEYVEKIVLKFLADYDLTDRVDAVITDNASTNGAVVDRLATAGLASFNGRRSWVRCFAHILNLVTEAILNPLKSKKTKTAEATLSEFGVTLDDLLSSITLGSEDDDDIPPLTSAAEEEFAQLVAQQLAQVEAAAEALPQDEEAEASTQREREQVSAADRKHLKVRREKKGDLYTTAIMAEALDKFQILAYSLRYKGKSRRAWTAALSQHSFKTERRVRRAVRTRWNSKLDQIEDVLEFEKVIFTWQSNSDAGVKLSNRLNPKDFLIAAHLANVLRPLKHLTHLVSTTKVSRMGDVISWIDSLTGIFDVVLFSPEQYPASLHNSVLAGHRLLQQYYSLSDDCDYYRMALLLHPSLRLAYVKKSAEWPASWVNKAVEIAKERFVPYRTAFLEKNPQPVTPPSPQSVPVRKTGLTAFLATAALSTSTSVDLDPLGTFLNSDVETLPGGGAKDAFLWWRSERAQGREWGGVTEMALDVFSTPVSSVLCERSFSFGRTTVSEKRHSMSDKTLAATMTVGVWAKADLLPDGLLANGKKWLAEGKKMAKLGRRASAAEEMVIDEE